MTNNQPTIRNEHELATLCLSLIEDHSQLSERERDIALRVGAAGELAVCEVTRVSIIRGEDPLGDAFMSVRSASKRRAAGAVYTPLPIVRSMFSSLKGEQGVVRVVDPGAGSGRFSIAASEAFPHADIVAVELDPLAALMLRANIAARGLSQRVRVLAQDYRDIDLAPVSGRTAYVGNPPYVRHHEIDESRKTWYAEAFARYGIKASGLAGMHLHFFLKTRLLAKEGDVGAFITASEWMYTNYGKALRTLMLSEFGAQSVHLLEPTVEAFPGTATTAAITRFHVGSRAASLRISTVERLDQLDQPSMVLQVSRERLDTATQWSEIVRPPGSIISGGIELGELFRVHRGQVTGGNQVWIAGTAAGMLPERFKVPAVTKAQDLIRAGAKLDNPTALRRVIDLPADFDALVPEEREAIEGFLNWAKEQGADKSYTAQHRQAWWSVGLKHPAPILCTYMARRPPQFTLNLCAARHINIAHGLYPREPLPDVVLEYLVSWLNENVNAGSGRIYAGGLAKFEPREIERLKIPSLNELRERAGKRLESRQVDDVRDPLKPGWTLPVSA